MSDRTNAWLVLIKCDPSAFCLADFKKSHYGNVNVRGLSEPVDLSAEVPAVKLNQTYSLLLRWAT